MAFARWKHWLYRGGRPNGAARAINGFFGWLHRQSFAPKAWVTLEVTGRKSGKPIAFPLAMVSLDGERYLVSMLGDQAGWVRNLRAAGGQAQLLHGKREPVRLEEIAVSQRPPVLKAYLQIAPGARPHIPVDKDAPLEDFAQIAAQFPVFRVRSGGAAR